MRSRLNTNHVKFNYLVCVFFVLVSLSSCAQETQITVRLIPKGYTGPVLIIFNQEDGVEEEYDKKRRVYRIPDSGILKTRFKPIKGFERNYFYYVDENNYKVEIPFVNVYDESEVMKVKEKSGIYAFWEMPIGGGSREDTDGKHTIQPARCFYIGELKDIDKAYNEQMDFIFRYH